MKKNIKVNVSGMLFNLDEDAYQVLENYLNKLERHFRNKEGSKEIIEDIERGIADMMSEKLGESKTIITIEDINEIIQQMGDPLEIDDEEDTKQQNQESYSYNHNHQKRLYRDTEDKVLAGVCSGISYYTNIDVAWVRILFIILFFVSAGFISVVYLVLWIAVPEAETTAQKLDMRGQSINIDNIERKIKEEINNLGDQLNNLKNKHFSKKKRSKVAEGLNDVLSSLVNLVVNIAKIFLIFMGIILTIGALSLLVMLIPAFVSGGGALFHTFHNFIYISIPDILQAISPNSTDYNLILYSLIALTTIPFLAIIIGGFGYLFRFRTEARGVNKALGVVWIISAILLTVSIFLTADEFEHREKIQQKHRINLSKTNRQLYLQLDPSLSPNAITENDEELLDIYDAFDNDFLLYQKDSLFYAVPELNTYNSEDSLVHIIIEKSSHGEKKSKALHSAKSINYNIQIQDSLIKLAPLYSFTKDKKWRNQHVKVKIYLPKSSGLLLIENPNIKSDLHKEIERELYYYNREFSE